MQLQVSPNNWSCMAASAAMALGVPVQRIVELCGHDGSHFPWPKPYDHLRAGFNIHEIIDITWKQFGLTMTPFFRLPMAAPHPGCPEQQVPMPDSIFPETRFTRLMQGRRGILTGEVDHVGHAVAWDGGHIYDPRGYRYRYQDRDSYSYEPDVFWMVGGLDARPLTTLS